MKFLSSGRVLNGSDRNCLNNVILRIQKGDQLLRERFIKQHLNFIKGTAARVKGSYIQVENDEEYAVALSAFNDAIDFYEPKRGVPFFNFAGLLIKRAIIDIYRKKNKAVEIPLSSISFNEDNELSAAEEKRDIDAYITNQEQFSLQQEIGIYTSLLKEFSIEFKDLVKSSPKHQNTRQAMMNIAFKLSKDKALRDKINRKKLLPLKEILSWSGCSRKTLERHRKYILANFILINSDLEYLKEYIKDVIKGGVEK